MKTTNKILIFLLLLTCSFKVDAQKIIKLNKTNGVYTLPCSVNGISGTFILDTGASTVTLSKQFANKLFRLGKLEKNDIVGYGSSQIANGQLVENVVVRIKQLSISGLNVRNIEAVVIDGLNAPLLLGLSAIQRLGKVTISDQNMIIESSFLTSTHRTKKHSEIDSYIDNDNYGKALEDLKELESEEPLDYNDYYKMALCYLELQEYDKCIICCRQWLGDFEDMGYSLQNEIYFLIGCAYNKLKKYRDANNSFAKAISSNASPLDKSRYYNQAALNYLSADRFDDCVESFDLAVQLRLQSLNYSIQDLVKNKVHDQRIGIWLNSIAKIYAVFLQDGSKSNHYNILSAKCGNSDAIEFCKHFDINYIIIGIE